jgi:hypothetical protein
MTPEDAAKQILDTFVHTHGLGPGGDLLIAHLSPAFKAAGCQAADCGQGVEFAIQRGWIEPCGIGRFMLTEAGAAAAPPAHGASGPKSWIRG